MDFINTLISLRRNQYRMKTIIPKHFFLTTVLLLSIGTISVAQQVPQFSSGKKKTGKALRTVQSSTNVDYLKGLAQRTRNREDSLRLLATVLTKEKGWTTGKTFEDGTVIQLMGVSPTGQPLYYTTHNVDAARTTSTDRVQPGGDLGLNLSGTGMIIGEWDGGDVLTTHDEFNNTGSSRVTDMDGFGQLSNHATHVAGTLIAGGAESDALGMAYNAQLHAYDWFNDFSEAADAAADGLLVSNHSYGYITGWQYFSDTDEWVWYGDPSYSEEEDYRFGFYSFESALIDDIAYNAPYYLYVKSAGNDRGDWDGFSDIPPDGGEEGYDCIGGQGNAKNILTIGAIQDIPDGYNSVSDVVDASFSSMGPSDDGRIKPDIVGNGIGLFSSLASDDNGYASYSGTSMSGPNVAGSLILLQEYYEELYAEYMLSSTLKALVISTADESGPNPGPDYKFGWGVLNMATAATTITNMGQETQIWEETYSSTVTTFAVTANGNEPLTATMVWTDPAGEVPQEGLDPTDIALINNLNLAITSGGATSFPYKLSASDPSAAATTGVNNVDNVEKVVIENPMPGVEYTLEISHTGNIVGGSQNYSLVITGLSSSVSDLRISKVYGLDQTGQTSGALSPRFYADIINSGDFISDEVTVQLDATGANPGFATGEFGSLNPTETSFAAISGYNPQNLGVNEITISLPEDDFNGNNSGTLTQETTEGTYSYSNAESPAENSLGFGEGEGTLLAKYPVSGTRSLTDIVVYLRSGTGNTIRALVMDTLGNILAHGDEYIIEETDLEQWVTLPLTSTANLTDAIVYAGVELHQGSQVWFPIGLQEESPAHPDAYYSCAIGGGEPVFGPYRDFDRWMIRLNTCKVLPQEVSVTGPETICEGSSSEFTVEYDGDSDVEWSIPDGWNGVVNGNTITVTPDENDGLISVVAFNECEMGDPQSVAVSVFPSYELSFTVELCQGESYVFPDGTSEDNIQSDFSYTSALESTMGCDSILVTNVMVYAVEDGSESITVCVGESVTFPDGTSEDDIQSDFSYTSTLESMTGCDSLLVTDVMVHDVEAGSETVSVCTGESVTFPDGTTEEDVVANFFYTSVIQSTEGCDSTVVSEVEVISIDNNLIEQEGNVLLAPENMETYSWLFCTQGSTEELGENTMSYSPNMNGDYAVLVMNSFGCTNTSPCYSFILNSVNGASRQSAVNVFPNPSAGELNISGMPVSRYQLYDISGRLVEDGLIPSPSGEVKLMFSNIPASLYMLRLFMDEGYEDIRVIFE